MPIDVKHRVGDLTAITGRSVEDAANAVVVDAILRVKGILRRKLLDELPAIFLNRNPYSGTYSWLDYNAQYIIRYGAIDSMLDRLVGLDELKDAAIAGVIRECYVYKMSISRLTSGIVDEDTKDSVAFWTAEFDRLLPASVKLIAFDFNGDGIIEEWERVRTRRKNRFYRT